jgi:hypothetical protein
LPIHSTILASHGRTRFCLIVFDCDIFFQQTALQHENNDIKQLKSFLIGLSFAGVVVKLLFNKDFFANAINKLIWQEFLLF